MATIVNGQTTFQGGEALPSVGSAAYNQASSGQLPTASYSASNNLPSNPGSTGIFSTTPYRQEYIQNSNTLNNLTTPKPSVTSTDSTDNVDSTYGYGPNYSDAYTQMLDRTTADSDQATKNLAATIQAQRQQNLNALATNYTNYESGQKLLGIQNNEAQTTPDLLAGHITDIENDHINKMNDIDAETNKALMDAQTARDNNDLATFKDKMDYVNTLRSQKQQALQDMYTQQNDLRDYNEKVREFNVQHADDQAILAATQAAVPVTAAGTPDVTAQAAFLAKLSPQQQVQVKGLTDYSLNPEDFPQRTTAGSGQLSRADAVAMAKAYDPTYDDAQYAARSSYLKNLQSGPLSTSLTSANKAIAHLTAFANSVTAIGNVPGTAAGNALRNSIESPFSPNLQTNKEQAETEGAGVQDELAKFFKGTGATDEKSIDAWASHLNPNATPAQLKGTVQGAITLLSGQLDSLQQQYTNTMGHAPTTPFLNTDTITQLSNLKNQGYKIDIPGVYYTDPTAYIKNDPDAAENLKYVTAENPGLSQADALQLAQYLEENGVQ